MLKTISYFIFLLCLLYLKKKKFLCSLELEDESMENSNTIKFFLDNQILDVIENILL